MTPFGARDMIIDDIGIKHIDITCDELLYTGEKIDNCHINDRVYLKLFMRLTFKQTWIGKVWVIYSCLEAQLWWSMLFLHIYLPVMY